MKTVTKHKEFLLLVVIKVLILSSILLLNSCSNSDSNATPSDVDFIYSDNNYESKIKRGGCTYIIIKSKSVISHAGYGFGMHDGECTNVIHKCYDTKKVDSLKLIIKELSDLNN